MPVHDRSSICRYLPHGAGAVLLDVVAHTDHDTSICKSSRHKDVRNPFRVERAGQWCLPASAAIEFAAQAIALHGALGGRGGSDAQPASAYIARLKGVTWKPVLLSDVAGELTISATCTGRLASGAEYTFEITAEDMGRLASGTAIVMFAE